MANKQTVFENNNKTKPVDDGWLNMVNEEYINLCIGTGQTPDADTSQLVKGAVILASQAYLFCVDSGTTNNYVLNPVSPLQAPPSLRNGLSIKFTTANANSGSTNINAYGFGNILAKNQDGTNLVAGDIPANTMVQFYYNGTNWILDKGAKATTTTQGISYLNNPITISNNALDANNDIDFSAGNGILDDGSGQVVLSSTFVKRLDATWSAGTGNGGLFNGTAVPKANSTKYYLFAITNGTINDAGFDSSATGANIPSGYKGSYRGMVKTDSSGNILAFKQTGNKFLLASQITEFSGTVASTYTNLTSTNVPLKSEIEAIVNLNFNVPSSETNGRSIKFKDLVSNQEKQVITTRNTSITSYATIPDVVIGLNSSGQFQYKSVDAITPATDSSTNGTFEIRLNGWIDNNIKL